MSSITPTVSQPTGFTPTVNPPTTGGTQSTAPVDRTAISKGIEGRAATLPEADRKLFKQLAELLMPSSNMNAGDLAKLLDKAEAAASKLSGVVTKDFEDLLARLLIERSASQRQNALDSRLTALMMQKAETEAQAEEMRNAATQMIVGAAIALVVSVIGAVASIGGTLSSAKAQAGDLKSLKETTSELKDAMENASDTVASLQSQISSLTTQIGALGKNGVIGQAFGQLAQQIASSTNTITQATAKMSDAAGTDASARADQRRSDAELAKAIYDKLEEFIQQMVSFLRDMAQNQTDLMKVFTTV